MPRSGSIPATLVAAVLVAAGCGPRSSGPAALTVVDDAGDTIALARPAVRVVSLIPAATELLFAIGAGPQMVGRTAWCDTPPEALVVPSLGDGLDPNLEAIVAARPDLVLLYPSPRTAQAAARLHQLAVATAQLRTDRLEDLFRAARLAGVLTGHGRAADSLVRATDSALARASRPAATGPTVLIVVWDQPPMTVGRGSFLHQIVERAGGRNLFADLVVPSAPVSLEAIAARDPDLILAVGDLPALAARPEWQAVRAVRERRFVLVSGTEFQRPSPRAAAAVAQLAARFDSLAAR